jgi:hypothetical protein
MNKTTKKLIAGLVISFMCFTLFSFGTSAVSLEERGSITLTAVDKDTKNPVDGARFRLYKIALAYMNDNEISYIYTDEFKNCGMDMGNFSDAYLPIHLMVHATVNAIAFEEKTSDSSGKVTFDNLQCGAYLIVPYEIKEGYLNPSPFIVTVPMMDEAQNKWIYNIDASPKIEADKDDTDEKTYISVKKIWETSEKTPDSIKVSLIKDGEIVDEVILSAENNWYHKWENLPKNHSWNVIETDVPSGYKASYITSQMTVIITNTDDDYEDETTTKPDETTTDSTTNPEDTTNPTSPTKPDDTTNPTNPTDTTENTTKPEELIDTGQLNWPIPAFSMAGLILFSVGWAMLNFGKKDEETA